MKVKELIAILKELPPTREILFKVDGKDSFMAEVKVCAWVVHENGEDIKKTELEPSRIEVTIDINE